MSGGKDICKIIKPPVFVLNRSQELFYSQFSLPVVVIDDIDKHLSSMCVPRVCTTCVHCVCELCVCTVCVYCVCALCVCTTCVHCVCVLCVCTVCVHCVCVLCVCTVCVYCVCALCVCTVCVYCVCVLHVCTACVYCMCVPRVCTACVYCVSAFLLSLSLACAGSDAREIIEEFKKSNSLQLRCFTS